MQGIRHRVALTDRVLAGRYEVLALIAEGGMGSVHLARQLGLRRRVAVKTLLPNTGHNDELVGRFRREADAIQDLTHPNTVRLYDFVEAEDGTLFLVMELLDGETLNRVLERTGPLPLETVAHIGTQVLKSLVEAHAYGITHRDIKPSNLMLCRQLGEVNFVKVLDFGLAAAEAGAGDFKTRTGATLGTPHYMSPEQVGGKVVDGRSDLYSLGLTLYELATGTPAYHGDSLYEVALNHLKPGELVLPMSLLGTPVGRVIARAVRKSADARYPSAQAMLEDLAGPRLAKAGPVIPLLETERAPISIEEPLTPSAPDRLTTQDLSQMVWAAAAGRVGRRRALAVGAAALLVAAVALASSQPWRGAEPEGPTPQPTGVARSDGAGGDGSVAVPGERVEVEPAREPPTEPERPVDAWGIRLAVTSEPPGATVLLGDERLCTTPCERRTEAGEERATLTVALAGHDPVSQEVDLTENVVVAVVLPATVQSATIGDAPSEREVAAERSSRGRSRSSRDRSGAGGGAGPARAPEGGEQTAHGQPSADPTEPEASPPSQAFPINF